jgi:tetratricopeptide (TPR) repeat protein
MRDLLVYGEPANAQYIEKLIVLYGNIINLIPSAENIEERHADFYRYAGEFYEKQTPFHNLDKALTAYLKMNQLHKAGGGYENYFAVGKVYEKQKQYEKALPQYELELAKVGEYNAYNKEETKERLGFLYLFGLGTTKDYEKATNYLHNAVAFRSTDYSLAGREYYFQISTGKSVFARYCLGLMYLKGFGVKQDGAKAYAWFKLVENKLNDHQSVTFIEDADLKIVKQGLSSNINDAKQLMKHQKTSIQKADQYIDTYYHSTNGVLFLSCPTWSLSEQQLSRRRRDRVKNGLKSTAVVITAPLWILPLGFASWAMGQAGK